MADAMQDALVVSSISGILGLFGDRVLYDPQIDA
jgi:hypothetical protein